MKRLYALVDRVAAGTISVLLLGETGVGKEIFARAVHDRSPRRDRPFLRLNSAAISESLLESELFGHEKGAFTGATATKRGLLEAADGGTVFLDEVGELPPSIQAKLLRVLEAREVLPVGGRQPRAVDVRFVAATNRDLEAEAMRGGFRQDLYFRLSGATIVIPPLRDRVEEIEPMANAFVAQAAASIGATCAPTIASQVLDLLRTYEWPGNIRELRNVMERAVLLSTSDRIGLEHVPVEKLMRTTAARPSEGDGGATDGDAGRPARPLPPLPAGIELTAADLKERQRILDALAAAAGNQSRAAEQLGIARRTLTSRLDRFHIPRPRKRPG
jgi:transcriptional regulator with GAF, ATPase, and Fis domain